MDNCTHSGCVKPARALGLCQAHLRLGTQSENITQRWNGFTSDYTH